jgi:hypothetical protein
MNSLDPERVPRDLNPYAPPAADRAAPASSRLHGFTLAYGAASALYLGLAAAAWILSSPQVAVYLANASFLIGLARPFLAIAWLYLAWAAVPPADRAEAGGPSSPIGALGRFLIPIYSLYWAFAVFRTLATAINLPLIRRGAAPSVAPGFGYLGVVTSLFAMAFAQSLASIPLTAADTMFFLLFMTACDKGLAGAARPEATAAT